MGKVRLIAPTGYLDVRHRDDPGASLTADGITYQPAEDGRIRIPLTALGAATFHGFQLAPRQKPAESD
jgi:hypothetical protein